MKQSIEQSPGFKKLKVEQKALTEYQIEQINDAKKLFKLVFIAGPYKMMITEHTMYAFKASDIPQEIDLGTKKQVLPDPLLHPSVASLFLDPDKKDKILFSRSPALPDIDFEYAESLFKSKFNTTREDNKIFISIVDDRKN